MKVPRSTVTQGGPRKTTIVGILDNSGSMSSAWPHMIPFWNQILEADSVSLVFSNAAKRVLGPVNPVLGAYFGAGTEIFAGFAELHKFIDENPALNDISIIFLSDGQDNNNATLKSRIAKLVLKRENLRMNFLCVGIGSGFPTFVAMDLRDKYHNGDAGVPPVFLINHVVEDAEYEEQFKLLKSFLVGKEKLTLLKESTKLREFPWGEDLEEVYEDTWVMVNEKNPTIFGTKVETIREEELQIPIAFEIFRKWVSKLQLESLKGVKVTQFATKALEVMQRVLARMDARLEEPESKDKKLTFHERMLKKQKRGILEGLNTLIKEMKNLSEANILNKLSEAEAAQRLAIGTQIGKYHNRALASKGITVTEYIQIRDNFIDLLTKKPLDATKPSTQEPSVFSLQNQKDVFVEKNLIEGLKMCDTQYDLIANFPAIGHSIQIKRTDGSRINPWIVQILSFAKHHKSLDTVSIQQGKNELTLSVGGDEKEVINAVLPLFSDSDADLRPFIRSKLYHSLMTFNVMQNVDTLFEQAYTALLAAAVVHLTSDPSENRWKSDVLDQIFHTYTLTCNGVPHLEDYLTCLRKTPATAMINSHPKVTTRCEDLSKPILSFFILQRRGEVNETEAQSIWECIFREYFGLFLPADPKIRSFFTLKDKKIVDENLSMEGLLHQLHEKYANTAHLEFQHMKDYHKAVRLAIEAVRYPGVKELFKLAPNIEYFKKDPTTKINLVTLERMYKFFMKKDFDGERLYPVYLVHGINFTNSYERNTSPMVTELDSAVLPLEAELMKSYIKRLRKNELKKYWAGHKVLYMQRFSEIHKDLEPITPEKLKEHCQKNNLKFEDFRYNPVTMMATKACMAPGCPYYLKIDPSLVDHFAADVHNIPGFNKTIHHMQDETPEEIWKAVVQGRFLEKARKCVPKIPFDINDRKEAALPIIAERLLKYKLLKPA